MTNTVKLYDSDPYQRVFHAKVLACHEIEDARFQVFLDQTLFFPEEGGQTADKGMLSRLPVVDVQIKDGVIAHILESPLAEGTEVEGCVDWNTRFSNMQQHTGEHILSGLAHRHYGYHNVGFHLSEQTVTLDFDGPLQPEQLTGLEDMANEVIARNVSVTARYPSAKELESLSYRSKLELNEAIRIVTIEDCDVCACCAPHVQRTGEIGMLKIIGSQRYKGGMRLRIACGTRALLYVRQLQEQADKVSVLLSVSSDAFYDGVTNLKEEAFRLKGRLLDLQSRLAEVKIAALPADLPDACLFFDELDQPLQVRYINRLTGSFLGICAVFVGNDTTGYRYMIGSSQHDVRPISKQLQTLFPSKGGGSAAMIQGHVDAAKEQLLAVFPAFL